MTGSVGRHRRPSPTKPVSSVDDVSSDGAIPDFDWTSIEERILGPEKTNQILSSSSSGAALIAVMYSGSNIRIQFIETGPLINCRNEPCHNQVVWPDAFCTTSCFHSWRKNHARHDL